MRRVTLRSRLYSLLVGWFVLFLIVSGCVTFFSFLRFRKNAVEERLLLARTVAHYLDSTTAAAVEELGRLATQLPSLDASAVGRLRAVRFQSPFAEAIYVLDRQGNRVVSDPAYAEPIPSTWLTDREAVTPLFVKPAEGGHPALAIVQPFKRDLRQFYLVSEMNPLGSSMSSFLQDLSTEPDVGMFVVDVNGTVIAAPDQKDLFQTVRLADVIGDRISARRPFVSEEATCNICVLFPDPNSLVTVMVPLRFAPWGVVVQQKKQRAFAALYTSQAGFLVGGGLLLLMGLFLLRALLRSVVSPIQVLSDQAERLRRGDFLSPITVEGDHEIEVLASTLDAGRVRLASTLAELQSLNEDLEGQVAARTRVLQKQYEDLRLLHHVAEVATRERDVDRFVPEILQLITKHYGFPSLAMVTRPLDAPPATYTHPEGTVLPWAAHVAEPPETWDKRELVHQGRVQGELYYPRWARPPEGVMEQLKQQLALSLHSAYLLRRTLVQDGQRRGLVRRLLDASEEERRRIARELHDEISQLLTVIQLSLEDVAVDTPEMRKAKELLGKTLKEIHRIIYDLRPSILDDLGLPAAIEWYATNYLKQKGIQVSLEVAEDLDLPPEIEIATFRIYQEIVTNILRHSHADDVSIELYKRDAKLVLAVEDDGVGFPPEEQTDGAGLVGMRERAALVNGAVTYSSEPGMGTHVLLEIPLKP